MALDLGEIVGPPTTMIISAHRAYDGRRLRPHRQPECVGADDGLSPQTMRYGNIGGNGPKTLRYKPRKSKYGLRRPGARRSDEVLRSY
jgi:hypothetical protein